MATLGSSTFRSRIKEDKPVTIKLDNIKQLTGQENYIIWESTMRLVWKGMKTYEIVVEGRVPNSPTGQVLEAGPGWPVLVMAMTGPD